MVVLPQSSAAEVMEIHDDVSVPTLKLHEVLVRALDTRVRQSS